MTWQRQILRVNLSEGTCETEPLNMEWANDYLGSRGLGSKYLYEEMDPAADPLSADNKLIFATGPLTGTNASTGGRYTVITKGPLTGAIACSNSGGKFGGELKNAGYDMLIIEGKAASPVYLLIQDGQAEIRDAGDLWGKTVWETEDFLAARHRDPLMRFAGIGQAGETLCRYACVVNDKHRAAGRSGVGAVMGAKKIKTIAVRGTRGLKSADPKALFHKINEINARLTDREGMARDGTLAMMDVTNGFGSLPTRNNRSVRFEGAHKLNPEAMHTPNANGHVNIVQNGACYACTIGCGRICKIDPEHWSVKDRPEYQIASGGLEYETAYALGAACGVDDIDAATFAGSICNEYGMDPISLGGSIAAAMELFDIGAIDEKTTGGIKLEFGNARAMCQVAELAGKGEGFGADIAMGSRRLCEKYGRPELSMTVKGQEFPAYDPRGIQGMGLAYATSNRGACHLRGYTVASEVLGIPVKTEMGDTDGKPELVKAFQDATALVDSAGLCVFTTFAWGMDNIAPQIDAACEGDWSVEKCLETGERIWNMERLFNEAAGFTADDDKLPKRLLKEMIKEGPTKGEVNRLGEMLPKYYEVRGWTPDGKIPKETRQRLSL